MTIDGKRYVEAPEFGGCSQCQLSIGFAGSHCSRVRKLMIDSFGRPCTETDAQGNGPIYILSPEQPKE